MRYAAAALFSLMLAGCSSDSSMVGKTVIATPVGTFGYNGKVLVVDSSKDGTSSGILPTFVTPFKATVLDVLPIVAPPDGDVDSPRWKMRIEDGDYAGQVVGVYTHMAELTIVP